MKCAAIIPARYQSSRLPGKLLLPIAGKPIIQHVWERVRSCREIAEIWVATDDKRIQKVVESFGGKAVMTSPNHQSGTDRIAEVAANLDADIVVNVQGDEPMISSSTIAEVTRPFQSDEEITITTACTSVRGVDELFDTNCVKVILDVEGFAIYFSRLPIPFHRLPGTNHSNYYNCIEKNPLLIKHFYKHVGIYAFRKEFLQIFVNLPMSYLEQIEKLEQLRLIENGYRIKVLEVGRMERGVDTREDYEYLKKKMEHV